MRSTPSTRRSWARRCWRRCRRSSTASSATSTSSTTAATPDRRRRSSPATPGCCSRGRAGLRPRSRCSISSTEMSESRQQVWIEAPKEAVWELIADVERHAEWWPRVVSVECEGIEAGCTYREVVQTPLGRDTFDLVLDKFDDPTEFMIRCVNSGTFFHLVVTEAQGGTF